VNLADEPPSFADTVIAAATERLGSADAIGNYQVDELTVGRRITYDVRANWKLIVENFMECHHCATIHPELTFSRDRRTSMLVTAAIVTATPKDSGSPPTGCLASAPPK
jgi:phenylpropionate dioxygenase-like ring-hydroxylating dioxygenase large terminal subunit